jgi:flagellar biosynthesis GTPase FlhF
MNWNQIMSGLIRGQMRVAIRVAPDDTRRQNQRAGVVLERPEEGLEEDSKEDTPEPAVHRTVPDLTANLTGFKSFYGQSPMEAMRQATAELGADAVIVRTVKTKAGLRFLGNYEVLCASAKPNVPPAIADHRTPPDANPVHTDGKSHEEPDFAEILRGFGVGSTPEPEADDQVRATGKSGSADDDNAVIMAEIQRRLASHGLPNSLGWSVVEQACSHLPAPVSQCLESQIWQALGEEMRDRLRLDDTSCGEADQSRFVAFVGPAGGGKTAAIRRYASHAMANGMGPVTVLSLLSDLGSEAGRAMGSGSSGFGEFVLPDLASLKMALRCEHGGELVLIDTPSYDDITSAGPLSEFLNLRHYIDVQLVLPLTLAANEISRCVDRFEVLRPDRLLFTMTDKRDLPGVIFREACRTGKAISFFTDAAPEGLGSHDVCADFIVKTLVEKCAKEGRGLIDVRSAFSFAPRA